MSDVLIKGMEMPEGCYYCPVLIGKANCTCAITGTKIRIEKAKSLIENTSLTIAEISDMTGFASQSYFSTAFKNYEGVTPTNYKHSKRSS